MINQLVWFLDLWDIEEIDADSQLIRKHTANEDSKELFADKTQVTKTGKQEAVKEVSEEVKVAMEEQVIQPAVHVCSEKQEKPVITPPVSGLLSTNEKENQGESSEMKEQQSSQETSIQESAELPAKKSEQISLHQPNNKEVEKSDDHEDLPPVEQSKQLVEESTSFKTGIAELQTLHKRVNSSGSVDSSWSKLSEEELKANGGIESA